MIVLGQFEVNLVINFCRFIISLSVVLTCFSFFRVAYVSLDHILSHFYSLRLILCCFCLFNVVLGQLSSHFVSFWAVLGQFETYFVLFWFALVCFDPL